MQLWIELCSLKMKCFPCNLSLFLFAIRVGGCVDEAKKDDNLHRWEAAEDGGGRVAE